MRSLTLFVLSICVLCVTAFGQQEQQAKPEPIETDRPTNTDNTSVLQPGQWQLETGFLYNRFDTGNNAYIGKLMLHYGVAKNFELRLLAEDGKERDRYITETVQSTYPLALSAKYLLVEDHPWLPDIALVGYWKLPFTSRSSEQSIYWSPSVIAVFKHDLSEVLEFEYNTGFMQEAHGKQVSWLGNAAFAWKPSDKAEVFAEYFAQYEKGEDPQHNVAGGVVYRLNEDVQLDMALGSTIANDQPNQYVTVGYSFRFGK